MIVVAVMPSRGRPARAWTAIDALLGTAVQPGTEVVLVVDDDDPRLPEYKALRWRADRRAFVTLVVLEREASGSLTAATNAVSVPLARNAPDTIIGNLGDDHVCKTTGWDAEVSRALERPGIAYGDDRLQGERLPTAPFISASIVNALGWYALPCCRHMFIDDAWKAIGEATGVLRFLPGVVIEHVHPATGAVPSDEGYARADASMEADRRAFFEWRNTTFYQDVDNVRRVLWPR